MELIRALHNLRPEHRGCVATIGNFDGVHLGHQTLIRRLREEAAARELPACVISFDPLPHEYFARGQDFQARLTYFREKYHAIAALGPERFLLLRFDQQLASMSPADFIRTILVEGLGVRHLIVGDDFRFGKKRAGDYATLSDAGEHYGFSVAPTDTVCVDNIRVSSTRVREHLHAGDFAGAARLLGRPFAIEGRVIYGKQLGRELGYPTANIQMKRHKTPVHGIFVVEVETADGQHHYGMANLGERPSVDSDGRTLLEVHLFDFRGNLYGQHLKTVFLHKLRGEQAFASLAELKAAIARDEQNARQWLAARPASH
ncbi:bifunctional riboflavin kinase/FAD synthetase [Granulosicoccaceae sp. 1_MG-2023]|nr:bifunctional riboflavin kinase/FAD synthetase [Granulosicoccaceae sp. 1_MG-2023]